MTTIDITRVSRDELERALKDALTSTGKTAEELTQREALGKITVAERDALTRYRRLASLHNLAA